MEVTHSKGEVKRRTTPFLMRINDAIEVTHENPGSEGARKILLHMEERKGVPYLTALKPIWGGVHNCKQSLGTIIARERT